MGITFQDFRGNVADVARPNRFLLSFPTGPVGVAGFDFTAQMVYHVKSASIPTRAIGDISQLYWFGQNMKWGGDPTFDDYSVTFINNVDWKLKNMMEQWVDLISNTTSNVRGTHGEYKGVIKLEQIGRGTNVLATYFMHGVYPKSIDAIEVDHGTQDALEEFTIPFSIDYWTSDGTPGAGTGEGLVGSVLPTG